MGNPKITVPSSTSPYNLETSTIESVSETQTNPKEYLFIILRME